MAGDSGGGGSTGCNLKPLLSKGGTTVSDKGEERGPHSTPPSPFRSPGTLMQT